jgi:ribonuclease HI
MVIINIIFDGGLNEYSNGSGIGYGSYILENVNTGERLHIERMSFEKQMTNNVSEYTTLITALKHTISHFGTFGTKVRIFGDSDIVRNQIGNYNVSWSGWKVNFDNLRELRDMARDLLLSFDCGFEYSHVERKYIVDMLGH